MSFAKSFAHPDKTFRGKPFWSWNGRLDPEELRRQLRVFKQMGLGGAFLHSRVGLDTEYLGDEWFDCIEGCVEECRELDMEAWLYDEDRWPSGAAGGLVTKYKKHRARFIVMEIVPARRFKHEKGLLGAWQTRLTDQGLEDLKPLGRDKRPDSGDGIVVLTFRVELMPCHSWFNGYTYLDTLSKEAVAAFIESTHEVYRQRIGRDFGPLVPGMFTDEPNYRAVMGAQVYPEIENPYAFLPWTPALPKIFKERYGYDVRRHLPELFLGVAGQALSRARHDYYDCITHLFTESFARQIGEWCERNKMMLTGHILLETDMRGQTLVVGNSMRFYEHMQAPGIDILTEHGQEWDAAKQCASVLNQTGRKWLLSELYGCTGWDFPFEGHKAIGDWQAALGVNLRCQHLSYYTMKGEAKRDYPASIHFQSPWWEHYRVVEDYYARVGVAMTQGQVVRRLLVINPIESMWTRFQPMVHAPGGTEQAAALPPSNDPAVAKLEQSRNSVRDWLLDAHLDFDYGDEEMMSRLASVGKRQGRSVLKVGRANYDAVLVPPMDTIRRSTLKLLERFQTAGGRVVFAGSPAAFVDAEASDDAACVAKACDRVRMNKKAVLGALEDDVRDVAILDVKGAEIAPALYMLRRDRAGRSFLFICNRDRTRGWDDVTVRVRAAGTVVELDPHTGEQSRIASQRDGEWTIFSTALPKTGSALFCVDPKPAAALPRKAERVEVARRSLGRPTATQLSEPNVLVLDRPAWRVGRRTPAQGPTEILRVDRAVRDALGVPHRSGQMIQPWARETPKDPPSIPVELTYTIQIETLPRGPVWLALETPERFGLTLNGRPVCADAADGWWTDPSIQRLPLDAATLRVGKNELVATLDFQETDNLETLFMLGDFGVRVEAAECVLIDASTHLGLGDWTQRGLAFFGGAVAYRFKAPDDLPKGSRVVLAAPDFKGAVARVLVDGQEAGFLAWDPYETDLTPWLKGGAQEITVEVFGSRRNCFGPLHQLNPSPTWTGPESFTTGPPDWSDAYVTKPCGLMKAPELIVCR